jgi:UDP-perosamine 4-acetyltransferase
MKTIVLCAGGHARVVIEALRSRDITLFGITDADAAAAATIAGVPYLGNDDVVDGMNPSEVQLANGCGNRSNKQGSGLAPRRKLYERFARKNFKFPPVIHAQAIVASDAKIGDGVQIMAGAIVQAGATIGENVIINTGAIVEHDCEVAAHAHIAPGAILCGAVTVGEESHIGAGAVILQGRIVKRAAVIGAGQVIRQNVADEAIVAAAGNRT